MILKKTLNLDIMTATGKRLNSFQHALIRPDAYIGSITTGETERWIVDETNTITKRAIKHNPGLMNIIKEIGANVVDNKWRSDHTDGSPLMKRIAITLDQSTGSIKFKNDGHFILVQQTEIPYEDHRTGKITKDLMYPAEVLFGDMLAGTNFEDDIERFTSGKNGMGSKATNVFSKKFIVDHCDGNQRFVQVYSNNGKRDKPKITSYKKSAYTSIEFIPDYDRFNYPGLDNDLVSALKYYAYEIAAMVNSVPVHLNIVDKNGVSTKQNMTVKDIIRFAKMHYPGKPMQYLYYKNEKTGDEVVLIESNAKNNEIEDIPEEQMNVENRSFVNGILCDGGGTHLDAWRDVIISKLVKAFNAPRRGKDKELPKASAKMMYPFFFMVVNCRVDKPAFNHQTKEILTSRYTGALPASQIVVDKLLKWEFVSKLEEKLMAKVDQSLAKKEKTSKRIKGGEKLTDAGWAGKARRAETVLYICEGQSASSLPVRGKATMENGHNICGIYAIRGKFINVLNATKREVENNEEVQILKQVIGLVNGVDYSKDSNFEKLRYGRVCILTDADDDGIHIRGLLLNFFWHMFPSLCKRNFIGVDSNNTHSTLSALSTPVVKAIKGKDELLFYSNPDFKKWYESTPDSNKYILKYYKGLGAVRPSDAADFFEDQKIVDYVVDGKEGDYMSLGFDSSFSDKRKEWITKYQDDKTISDYVYEGPYSISDFVDKQLVIYHDMTIHRAMACLYDGLKEVGRKILFGMYGKRVSEPVEKLAGNISSVTHYHHAVTSMQDAIMKMAQGFVGTNNIPLFINDGEMGTRIGASGPRGNMPAARYPLSCVDPITHKIYRQEDELILTRAIEDNVQIEYQHYISVLPMPLVNGCNSVGCGWSTNIPNHNPEDIVRYLKVWIDNKQKFDELPHLKPWYRGFIGDIDMTYNTEGIPTYWTSTGKLEQEFRVEGIGKNRKKQETGWWTISEAPIGLPTYKLKKFLEQLLIPDNGKPRYLLDIEDKNTANTVNFKIKPTKDYIPDIDTPNNLSILRTKHALTNMVLIDENNRPTKYKSTKDIIDAFAVKRMEMYKLRKTAQLEQLSLKLKKARNKYSFIQLVVDEKLKLNQEDDKLVNDMKTHKLEMVDNSYEYLLSMQMRSMTKKRLDELKKSCDNITEQIKTLSGMTEKQIWLNELDEFEQAYKIFLNTRVEEVVRKTKRTQAKIVK